MNDVLAVYNIFNARVLFVIVIISGIVIAFALYSLDEYSLLYYGDAVSHLIGSRKIIDWQDPGLEQFGTIWLPLPHLLFLLPSAIDQLFFSGFAGLFINLPALAITTVLIYKIIRRYTEQRVAFFIALLYPINFNILYLGITTMTESIFMLFVILSAYYLLEFLKDRSEIALILSSISVAFATLCRYEAWILPLFLTSYAIIYLIRYRRYYSLFSLLSFAGIIFWLSWNAYYYNDPLEFANAEYYSALEQAKSRDVREILFLNPLNTLSIYFITMIVIYGPLILTAILGYKNDNKIFNLYLAFLPIFTILSMLIGIGEMSFWFNSRFLILVAPLLLLLTSMLYTKVSKKRFMVYLSLIFTYNIVAIPLTITNMDENLLSRLEIGIDDSYLYSLGIVTYIDAKNGFNSSKASFVIGEYLRDNYDDGNIMIVTGTMEEHKIMISSWIPLHNYDEIIESSSWKRSFKEPWLYDKWIIITDKPAPDAVNISQHWIENISKLYKHYDLVYEYEHVKILKRKY